MASKNRNKTRSVHQESAPVTETPIESVSEESTNNATMVNDTKVISQTLEEDIKDTEVEKVTETSVAEKSTPSNELESYLINFIETTSVEAILTPEEIARAQFGLFNKIKSIFSSRDQEDFNKKFKAVLSFFNKSDDKELSLNFIFRHPYAWPGSKTEYDIFRRMIYLIVETANPKNRKKALEGISLEKVSEGLSQKEKEMLVNFYE
jgi:hypothetical protein